jgi:16S rRNA processing protein RimM
MNEDLLLVGRIARAHGNKGQVIVNSESDFADERFREGVTLLVGPEQKARKITSARFHQGRPVIAFEGIESMDEADALANAELRMPLSEMGTLPAHTYYRHDLVGCQVEDTDGRLIGNVTAVEGPMEASRLVIAAPHGEVLIPLVAEICVDVDTAMKLIRVAAPEGLLELNVKQEL